MTVYTFDLLLGYEANGVDNAQGYRAQILEKLERENKFIFTKIPPHQKRVYFRTLGIPEKNMLILPFVLANAWDIRPTLSVTSLKTKLGLENASPVYFDGEQVTFQLPQKQSIIFYVEQELVYQVEYLQDGKVYQREYYASYRVCRELLHTTTGDPHTRHFFKENGQIAYETHRHNGKDIYRFGSQWIEDELSVMIRFIKTLNLTAKDTVLMDRTTTFVFPQALLESKTQAKLGCVIHSIHSFNVNDVYFEYYYLFKYAEHFDFMIVSTDIQKQDLETMLQEKGINPQKIAVIPVGSLTHLRKNASDTRYKAMVVARLDHRKRLDLAIRAVVQAKTTLPELTLDIYGQGYLYPELHQLIKELKAEEYIHLKGYQDVHEEYLKHSLYLATAKWETLGLTLLEGIGSGIGLVGFDVKYGNKTFIQHEKNGVLVPFKDNQTPQKHVDDLTEGIIQFYTLDKQKVQQASYALAATYLDVEISKKWENLFDQI
jgi:accessory Sec system glycosylation protein GtfA